MTTMHKKLKKVMMMMVMMCLQSATKKKKNRWSSYTNPKLLLHGNTTLSSHTNNPQLYVSDHTPASNYCASKKRWREVEVEEGGGRPGVLHLYHRLQFVGVGV